MKTGVIIFSILMLTVYSFKSVSQITDPNYQSAALYGTASFYGDDFHGRQTASGQRFNMDLMTAACNVLPIGTMVIVINTRNDKFIVVRINDRLSKSNRRILDLSMEAARKLDFIKQGLAQVRIEILSMGNGRR
jgi:rare lipoprotein A